MIRAVALAAMMALGLAGCAEFGEAIGRGIASMQTDPAPLGHAIGEGIATGAARELRRQFETPQPVAPLPALPALPQS